MANLSPHPPAPATLSSFNAAPAQDAERDVLACCASRAFAKAIADGRPYRDPAALLAAVDAAFDALTWDDIAESMNGHPRIGDRAASSGMSAAEQSGAAAASDQVRQGLAEGNLAYEEALRSHFPDLRQRRCPARRCSPSCGPGSGTIRMPNGPWCVRNC